MNLWVGRVFKLLRHKVVGRIGIDDLLGFLDGTFHPFRAFGQDDLGSQRFHHLATFDTHGGGHG